MGAVRIFIASADERLRLAFVLYLDHVPGLSVIGMTDRSTGLLAQLEGSQPDALLLDWELHPQPAVDLLSNLKGLNCPTITIVLSANPDKRETLLAAGADYFICKDAPPDALLPILTSILDSKSMNGGFNMNEKRVTGPIQVFVIGFDKFEASGHILAELKRVRKRGVIRVIDLLFVQKDSHGGIENSMHLTDLSESERQRLGSVAGALIGLQAGGLEGAEEGAAMGALAVAERDYGMNAEQLKDLADSIPNGSAAAILVIEHHWAARLRDAIAEAGGRSLAQAMITPEALMMVGAELEAIVEAQEAIEVAEAVKTAASMEIAQVLEEMELIEEAAMQEAAEVVATALAIEDAAAEDVAETLLAAELIEEAAMEEAVEAVEIALEVEEEAEYEAEAAIEEAEAIKEVAALDALQALIAAELIKEEAAREAVDALVTAEIIKEEAAEEAMEALMADDED